MSSSRAGLRFFQSFRQNTSTLFRRQQNLAQRQRRTYADAPAPAVELGSPSPQQNWLVRVWHSEVGPKTVHFWAPVMKWGLVIAGAADFARPAESLSITQNGALMATGLIWTRWCLIIKPRNVLLASVNFLLGCVGFTQVTRILLYRRSLEGKSAGQEIKDVAKDDAEALKSAVNKAVDKVKA